MIAFLEMVLDTVFLFYYAVESIFWSLVPLKYKSKDISGQVVLVTGAGGGIGRLLCIGLAKLGCKIICWDVAEQANEETVRLIKMSKGEAYAYHVDLTKKEDIYQTAEHVKKEIGKVNILINTAGVLTGKNLLDCSDELIQRTFDVNIICHFWTVKSFLPDMIKQNSGHIVTVASLAGMTGMNRMVDYCASKFAAVGFDEALRTELHVNGHNGVKTTVVCPYFVKTPLFQGIDSKTFSVLEPEDVARETINAILTNEQICIIPRFQTYFMMLKAFLPVKAQLRLVKAMRLDFTMNTFQGPKTKFQ